MSQNFNERPQEPPLRAPCHCTCGYRCGGPGICKLSILECLEAGHFVRDCAHDFSGWREIELGGTAVCTKCGTTAIGHDMRCGP